MLTQQVELGRVAFEVGTLVHEASVRRGLNRDQPPLAVLASCRYDICVAITLDEDSLRPKLQISPSSSRLMYHMHNACN